MKTAVIYARYSSDNQTEQSIEGQLRVCHNYANNNDIVIADTYIDRAMTGMNDNRESFQRMLKDSYKHAWDCVLVYKLDRFSRNKYEMAMHKKTLRDNGIKLISATENIPKGPEGIILESLLEGMAEYYSAELSQKVKRGMNETRQKENYTGGYMLYGYKKDGKKIVIDEEKAEVVKYIYEQYAKNVIVKNIIKDLTDRGILNKGKPFARNTIYNILKNDKYSGVYRFGDDVFYNTYPKIIPDDLFEIVHNKIESNKYGKRSSEVVYLLREKMTCGYCGMPVSAETGTSKSGKVKRYYKCLGKKRGNKTCQQSLVGKDVLENLIITVTKKAFQSSETISFLADKLIERQKIRNERQATLTQLQKRKQEIDKSIENIVKAIEKGIVTNTTKNRLEQLEAQQEDITAKILIEKSKLKATTSKEEIMQFLKKGLNQNAEQMIQLLIKKIVLYNDKIEITYNYVPKQDDVSKIEDMTFYKGKTKIEKVIQNKSKAETRDINIELKF